MQMHIVSTINRFIMIFSIVSGTNYALHINWSSQHSAVREKYNRVNTPLLRISILFIQSHARRKIMVQIFAWPLEEHWALELPPIFFISALLTRQWWPKICSSMYFSRPLQSCTAILTTSCITHFPSETFVNIGFGSLYSSPSYTTTMLWSPAIVAMNFWTVTASSSIPSRASCQTLLIFLCIIRFIFALLLALLFSSAQSCYVIFALFRHAAPALLRYANQVAE